MESAKPFNEIPSDLSLPIVGTTWMTMPLIGNFNHHILKWSYDYEYKLHYVLMNMKGIQ